MVDLNSKPEIVGYFSIVDGENFDLPDSSQLMYYKRPLVSDVHLDLNQGIEMPVPNESEEDGRTDHLLKWIEWNYLKIRSSEMSKWIEPKFVGSCEIFTKLLCGECNEAERWIIRAAKFKGTIYLREFYAPVENQISDQTRRKLCSWGLKFEQCMLSGAPGELPDVSKPVVELDEVHCVYRRKFGDHTILFSAKIDGVRSEEVFRDRPLPLLRGLKFVHLKTHKIIEDAKQDADFKKFELPCWWAKSFLVDVDEILCGFRDHDGIVHSLKTYSRDEIVNEPQDNWTPMRCIEGCRSFLGHVEDTVRKDCDKIIYEFEKVPRGEVITRELPNYLFLRPSLLITAELT